MSTNWSTNPYYPGFASANDDVIIAASGWSYSVTLGPKLQVRSLKMGPPEATLRWGSLVISEGADLGASALIDFGFDFYGSQVHTITGTATIESGGVTAQPGGTLVVSPGITLSNTSAGQPGRD
jgi:hypothetical protein